MPSNYPQFRAGTRWGDLSANQMQRMTKGAAIAENLGVQGPFLNILESGVTRNISVDIDVVSNHLISRLPRGVVSPVAGRSANRGTNTRSGLWGCFTPSETMNDSTADTTHVAEISITSLSPKPGEWFDLPARVVGALGGSVERFWSLDTFVRTMREHRGADFSVRQGRTFFLGTSNLLGGFIQLIPQAVSERNNLLLLAGINANGNERQIYMFDMSITRELTFDNLTLIDVDSFGRGTPVTISGVTNDGEYMYLTYDNAERIGGIAQYRIDPRTRSGLIFKVNLETLNVSGIPLSFSGETPRGGAVIDGKYYNAVTKGNGIECIQERQKNDLSLLREVEQRFLKVRSVG